MSSEERTDWPARIGQAMLFGAWVTGLALLGWWFDDWLERAHNPNPNPATSQTPTGAIEVALKRNRRGHYVASGKINGEPVRFLIDTGATHVAIPLAVARRLKLSLGPQETYQTAAGLAIGWSTRLDQVELGGLVRQGVRASVLPDLPGEEVLLGMSFLKHLEMIQSGDLLILRQQPTR